MKIVICNTPLREEDAKTVYPPLGAMSIVQCLQTAGFDARFYDVNYVRPSQDAIQQFFLDHQFDIVGISATTSSTYNDTKAIARLAKAALPRCQVVVGGALTSSAETLLRLGGADFTVQGEGELIALNLVTFLAGTGLRKDVTGLKDIKGISFLDDHGDVVFTGYERQLTVKEIPYPDYEILRRDSVLDQYIPDPFVYEQFKYDERSFEPHRKGKRLGTVVASRGCIARCTFCHRWQQGIRMFSIDSIIDHTKHLIERYNVGFISFGDEDFGATKKWIAEFAERIKELDVLYRLSAVRVDNINGELLKMLRNSGCIAVHYGWESGSDRMLRVMEKMTTVSMNIQSGIWTHEAGMQTVPALVVGMPGENHETIEETTDFLRRITEFLPREPIISANLLVPLPGTPVYEYARQRGYLGTTLEDEERYLISINDKDGASAVHINLTDYPSFIVQGWIRCIMWGVRYHYYRHNKLPVLSTPKLLWRLLEMLIGRRNPQRKFSDGITSHPLFYRFRYVLAPLYVALYTCRELGWRLFAARCWELICWPFRKRFYAECLPLRQYLKDEFEKIKQLGTTNVKILRLGR